MPTTFHLVRHGDNDTIGRSIAGRLPGIHLNDAGRRQADRVAERLAPTGIDAVCSSPLTRALETAAPLARRRGLEVEIREDLNEVDFSHWSGSTFEALKEDALWRRFNRLRSAVRAPDGEFMAEVQARTVGAVLQLRDRHPDGTVALVFHGDPIRSVICYFLGVPIDFFFRLDISPASVSTLVLGDDWVRILSVNETGFLSGA